MFNGDVLTQVDLAAVLRLHRERKAKATIVLTPVDNPTAYGLVETDADGNVRRFLEKPKPDEITCDTINAGIYVLEPETFDRIPKDTPWSIERSFFPSLIERGETFVAYTYRGYWIDIGTPGEVHPGAPRHHGRPVPWRRRSRAARDPVWMSPDARVEEGATIEGPAFIDEGVVVKAGARIGPYTVHRPTVPHRGGGDRPRLDHLGQQPDRPRGGRRGRDPRPPLPRRPRSHRRRRRRARRQVGGDRLEPDEGMNTGRSAVDGGR